MGRMLLLGLMTPSLVAGQESVEFSGSTWTIRGDAAVEHYVGQEALRMRGARAVLEGSSFQNGTIEFDFASTGHRSFAGVGWRVQLETSDYEHFYLRPHQADRFDALQYTPVHNGVSAWQLYPEGNAQAAIPPNEWIHVRLVVAGARLEVYVGATETPTMTVERMAQGDSGWGAIIITSGVPGGAGGLAAPEGLRTTSIANFLVTAASAPRATEPAPATDARFVQSWELSEAFPAPAGELTDIPDEAPSHGWATVDTDPEGRLNIARFRALPEGESLGMVLARVTIQSDTEQMKGLNLGFSDMASVFLNGQLLYRGNNAYLSRSGRYLGVMTIDNDLLVLPLRRGANELVVAIAENFGGWGLTARLEDLEGVSVAGSSGSSR